MTDTVTLSKVAIEPSHDSLTLERLVAMVVEKCGTLAGVATAIAVSRQRLYSAVHGGPPLRADRLVRLASIAGVDACAALRAGGQARLAALLDEAYEARFADATPAQRTLLRAFGRLSDGVQQAVVHLLNAIDIESETTGADSVRQAS